MPKFTKLLFCVILATATASFANARNAVRPPQEGGETKDRVSPEQMQALVKRPMTRVEKGDMEGAARIFETVLVATEHRYSSTSVQVADLLSSFGVKLYYADRRAESVPYLRRAVAAYRQAFGSDDPEVAVALHTYATAVFEQSPETVDPAVADALREALQIRRIHLGLDNGETAVTYIFLGRVMGNPSNTKGDDVRIDEAIQTIDYGIDLLLRSPNGDESDLLTAYRRIAEVDALNGRGADAVAAVDSYVRADPQPDEVLANKIHAVQIEKIVKMLDEHGGAEAAQTLRNRYVTP